jgi:hypothetical protein
MDQGYDFDIENYNDLELLKFFQLPHNTTNDMIVGKIDTMIQQFGLQRPKNDVEHEFRNFLILSKKRLLKYAESIPPIQLKPTNYDILHSQSALQGANHAVAVEKNIPVINAYEYQFPTGVINPIEKRVITKILNVDSLFRENYDTTNSSNFTWALPNEIKNIVSMNIVSMELPAVWYSVSSKNNSNTFQVKLYNMTDQPSIAHIIELPDGNYTPSEFVMALNNYFINTENGLEFLVAEINPRSMQTVIRARIPTDTPSGPSPYSTEDPRYSPDFYFILEFENYNTNDAQKRTENNLNIIRQYNPMQKMLGWYMGYRNSTYTVRFENTYIDEISSPMGPIEYNGYSISEAAYGSSSQNYIFVEVNDYNKNFITDSIISITNNAYIGNNILGRISLSVTNNTVFNNSSDRIFKLREYLGPVKIKKLNVRLLNKFGDMVDLNNSYFSMSIEFKLLY